MLKYLSEDVVAKEAGTFDEPLLGGVQRDPHHSLTTEVCAVLTLVKLRLPTCDDGELPAFTRYELELVDHRRLQHTGPEKLEPCSQSLHDGSSSAHSSPVPAPENERFIYDSLVRYADGSVKKIYEIWKRKKKIDPFLLSWPATVVKAYDGSPINDICSLELPKDQSEWPSMFRDTVRLTNPFAVLLCEQRDKDIHLIIESEYGTRSWTIPIQRRGDVTVLGRPDVKTDVESIGMLWRPREAAQA